MNLKTILLIVLMIFVSDAFTQEGIHVGAVFSGGISAIAPQNAYGFTKLDFKFRPAGSAAIEIDGMITRTFGISVNAGYDNIGARYIGEAAHINTTRKIDLQYLRTDILLSFIDKKRGNFYFQIGPRIGYLLQARQTYNPVTNVDDDDPIHPNGRPDENFTITGRFNKTDISGTVKTGLCIELADKLYMKIGGTFFMSLSDINHKDWQIKDRYGKYSKSRNYAGGLEFGIHYSFNK